MILDAVIITVFAWCAWRGSRRGLGESLIRFASLAASIVLGALFTRQLVGAFEAVDIDKAITENLRRAAESDSIDLTEFLPEKLAAMLELLGTDSTNLQIARVSEMLINVLSFLIIVFIIWLIASRLRRRLRKSRAAGGFAGTVDSSVGLLFGALKGTLLVLLLLAFMFPLAGVFAPDRIPLLTEQLHTSFIAELLYDNNPLLMFVGKTKL